MSNPSPPPNVPGHTNAPGPYGQPGPQQHAPVVPAPPPGYGYSPGYGYPPGYGYAPAPPTNTFAVISLVASLASMLVLVGWIPGIVFGHLALRQIERTGEGGRNLAMAGLIVGYIFGALIVLGVLIYIAFVVFIVGMVGMAAHSASTA